MKSIGKNRKKQSLRASNVELESREISVSADDSKIYLRDVDNLYPLRVEKIINNSPTAKRCANMMAKYIVGDGFLDEIIVNRKGETLNDIADLASNEISTQYGVFFHISWKFGVDYDSLKPTFEPTDLRVLDSVKIAKSKEDDDDYQGKFYRLEMDYSGEKFQNTSKKTKWYYPYNDSPKVILDQMKKDCLLRGIEKPTTEDLIRNYRGQIYYLNLTPKYHYALPPWDSVYDDMDTEYRISRYNNGQARNGWLGKVIIKKFADDSEEMDDENFGGNFGGKDTFNETLKKNMGADNASDVLVVDIPVNATEDVEKAFKIDLVKAQFDDKLFESTKKTLKENISGAFNNIPWVLISAGDGSLFGTNSETYLEAKKFYWEQNEYERFKLEKTLSKLIGREVDFLPIKGVES